MAVNKMEDVLTDRIVGLDDAIIVPNLLNGPNSAAQRSGVFDSQGIFVRESITFREIGEFNSEPELPDPRSFRQLRGRYMYGGVLFGHFGHFLVDSLARIWAVSELQDKIDGIVFTPKTNRGDLQRVVRVQSRIARALDVHLPFINTGHPLRVEKLYVPSQGIGLNEWCIGSPGFRRFVQKLGRVPGRSWGNRIYLSRSALPKQRSSYLSEKILESYLQGEGYTIVHPQHHPIEEQIALYREAEYIISPDGSPLHLLAYVGNGKQKVAVISRRNAETSQVFERQLRAFQGCHVVTLNSLVRDWIPETMRRPGRTSWGELDMQRLYVLLKEAGFIAGVNPWRKVSEEVLNEELAEISKVEGLAYRPYQPPPGK